MGDAPKLESGRWYTVAFSWDSDQGKCWVFVNERLAAVLPQLKLTDSGPNYLRLHAAAEREGDTGFLVEQVEAEVSRSVK